MAGLASPLLLVSSLGTGLQPQPQHVIQPSSTITRRPSRAAQSSVSAKKRQQPQQARAPAPAPAAAIAPRELEFESSFETSPIERLHIPDTDSPPSPDQQTPTQAQAFVGVAKKSLWDVAIGSVASPTAKRTLALTTCTGVQQHRHAVANGIGRCNKDLMIAEDAVDEAFDVYRNRMHPNVGGDVATFASMHPEAVKTACHDYMQHITYVSDVMIVTDKYRELKGLCEREYDCLSQRMMAEAKAAAARVQKSSMATITAKIIQQRKASAPGTLVELGRRVSVVGGGDTEPASSHLSPDKPWPLSRGSHLDAVEEAGLSMPAKAGYMLGSSRPHATSLNHSDGSSELKLPCIDRNQLNTGTLKFIDEDPPQLASNYKASAQLAFSGVTSSPTKPLGVKPPMTRDRGCVSEMGTPTARDSPASPHQKQGSVLLGVFFPSVGGAQPSGKDKVEPLSPGVSEKVNALVSSWEKSGPRSPQRGVLAAYPMPHDNIVRLHHSRTGSP